MYGGPFLHLLDGDINLRCNYTGSRSQYDLEEDVQIGGFLGFLFDICPNVGAMIEGQITSQAYLLAAGVLVNL